MSRKKKNYVIIFALVVLVLSVGYAPFAQKLADKLPLFSTGEGPSGFVKEWDVGFVNAKPTKIVGNAAQVTPVSYTLTRGWFNVTLEQPGDSITYDFTIKNMGIIDAKVKSIDVFASNKKTDSINFNVEGLNVGDVLKPGQTTELYVTAFYNNSSTEDPVDSQRLFVVVNYVQNS